MHIIIAGGGKVGYYLSKTLLSYGHTVNLIEKDAGTSQKLADELNIPVINGDATRIDLLKEIQSEFSPIDIFIAVTGQDEENLIACQLAKRNLGIRKTIARVNNPKNINAFRLLGVDRTVSSTAIIAELIEEEVDFAGMKILTSMRDDKVIVSEVPIHAGTPAYNRKIKDVKLPAHCQLAAVIKNGKVLQPSDSIVLDAGDSVIVISSAENRAELCKAFLG